jgi:hypothetical protein
MITSKSPDSSAKMPSELWAHIFRLTAGESMGSFDTSPLPPCSSGLRSWTPRSLNYNEYAEVIRTRTRLVLVNKFWRSLALELLYESVVLRKARSLPSFIQALNSDRLSTQSHNEKYPERLLRPATWFVRRLEIYPEAHSSSIDKVAIGVFEYLVNLTVLTIEQDRSDILSNVLLHQILLSGCSLHHFQTDCSSPLYSKIIQSSRFALEFLSIEFHKYSSFTDVGPLDLPLTHTIILRHPGVDEHNIIDWLIECRLPSLKRLILEPSGWMLYTAYLQDNPLRLFFQTFGRTVTSLDLNHPNWHSNAGFNLILPCFPFLEALTIQIGVLVERPPWHANATAPIPFQCPNLAQMSLRMEFNHRGNSLEYLVDKWTRCMSIISDGFIHSLSFEAPPIAPNLKCIHLMDISSTKFERARWTRAHIDMWEGWISEFRDSGVRFEFSTGDLVAIPAGFVPSGFEDGFLLDDGLGLLDA